MEHQILHIVGPLHHSDHLTKYEELQLLHAQVTDLKQHLAASMQEISMLTDERDEVVAAIKRWSKADRTERQELLYDAELLEMRTELKMLRAENKRSERENAALRQAQCKQLAKGKTDLPAPRRMRA